MMRSLRGLIICEDPDLKARILEVLGETSAVEPTLVLQHYPARAEAARQIRLCRPEVALLAIDRLPAVVEFLRELEASASGVPVICISHLQDPRALSELMRYGIRDCVAAPLNRIKFRDAIERIVYHSRASPDQLPREPLISFLPAQGGSGTSTLACNISHSMSRLPGAHVLLADFDMTSGLSRFLFKLTLASSLGEMLDSGRALDGELWWESVGTVGPLDVLHSGCVNPRSVITPAQVRTLIDAASRRYTAICADLTGSMETYSLELLRRSRKIVLVTTTEIPAIALAREKIDFLEGLDLFARIGVVLTLCPGASPPMTAQFEAYLRAPIEAVFDFGEKRARQHLAEGTPLGPKTALYRQIEQFAGNLARQATAVEPGGSGTAGTLKV